MLSSCSYRRASSSHHTNNISGPWDWAAHENQRLRFKLNSRAPTDLKLCRLLSSQTLYPYENFYAFKIRNLALSFNVHDPLLTFPHITYDVQWTWFGVKRAECDALVRIRAKGVRDQAAVWSPLLPLSPSLSIHCKCGTPRLRFYHNSLTYSFFDPLLRLLHPDLHIFCLSLGLRCRSWSGNYRGDGGLKVGFRNSFTRLRVICNRGVHLCSSLILILFLASNWNLRCWYGFL